MNNNIMHLSSRLRSIFFSMALMVLLISCMEDQENLVRGPVELAYVSIYHAAPAAPGFNVIVDGRLITSNPFDYSSYSGYLDFITGKREIRFTAMNPDKVLMDTTFDFVDQKAYSLFAINRLSKMEALLIEDSAATPAPGYAMVRFVHLSPDAQAFDVVVDENKTPLFSEKSFREATDFRQIPADTYDFKVKSARGMDPVLSVSDVDILPGRFYTIVTRGFVSPPAGNHNILSLEILD